MLSVLLSWGVILIISYLFGKSWITLLYDKENTVLRSTDVYVVSGIMLLNVYVQIFSLFHKVAAGAMAGVCLAAVVCSLYLIRKREFDKCILNKMLDYTTKNKWKFLVVIICVIFTALWCNIIPQHYDTYLYHAQAIHWIEEYGIVPGLGNLHFRLAYNSAFMSLQALFSFRWLLGSSLHTVNGFVVAFLLSYFVISFRREKGNNRVSDWMKLGAAAYILSVCYQTSSPNTDTWALLLVGYICIKWCEFAEKGTGREEPYAFLCILAVYAVTLKLSTAAFLILTVYPAVIFIRNRKWKAIIIHILWGIIIIIPFLSRNVMISGYLVYPYPEIDFFHVDWKMYASRLIADRREITAWARGNKDSSRYADTFMQWLPEWFQSIHVLWKVMFVMAVIIGIILLVRSMYNFYRRENIPESVLHLNCVVGLVFWLVSAPLPRYGEIYFLMIPCIGAGICMRYLPSVPNTLMYTLLLFLVGGYVIFYFVYAHFMDCTENALLLQSGYADHITKEYDGGQYVIYAPVEGDQTGYEPFPSVPYIDSWKDFELRGDDLGDGFRRVSRSEEN